MNMKIRTSDTSTPDDQQQHSGAVKVAIPAVSGDSGTIGLKLGKRTYFEAVKAIPTAIPSPSCVPAAKKQQSALQGTHMVPRCQVEGCEMELTAAKDYHRRHKVCELHSKFPKVIVNGIEQRFCQQCSRFHTLSEFDEGKRSCRRRLAGHNQRRRKPQLNSTAMKAARFASTFYDDGRLSSILMARSPFMHPRIASNLEENSLDFKLGGYGKGAWPRIKAEDVSSYDGQLSANTLSRHNAERLLFLLQGSKTVPGGAINQGTHQYRQSSRDHVGQSLTLSSCSGENLAGLNVISAPHGLSGVSDSGCALSLLSTQSGGPRSSGSASFDMTTRSGLTMDQLILEDQPLMAQAPLMQGVQHNFGHFAEDKLLTMYPQSSTNLATGGFPAAAVNSMDKQHQGHPLVSDAGQMANFGGNIFGLLQGSSFRGSQAASSQDIQGTIDLMCTSSETQTNDSHDQLGMVHQGSKQFTDLQLLRSFESSIYDTHQLL